MNYKKINFNKPTVSVIIPIHNRFLYANQAIDSVISQTYRPIELIILDDHSEEIYSPKFKSKKNFQIKILRHEQNKGPGASRETGRQAATGDFIAYLDSDDLWHPQKLQKQVTFLQSHADSGMCYCQSMEFNQWPLTGNEPLRYRSQEVHNEFLPVILEQRPWGTGACLWTREATKMIGPWYEGWHFEDIEYESRAGCKDVKISYVPEVLCYFRQSIEGGRLSSSLSDFSIRQISQSIMKISTNLESCGKLHNNQIRVSLIKRVFKTAFMALNHHDRFNAFKLFLKLSALSGNIPKKIMFSIIALFSLVLPVNIMNQIKYRMKNFFL